MDLRRWSGDAATVAFIDLMEAEGSERRRDHMYQEEPLALSIGRPKRATRGPFLLVNHGDNAGAGGERDEMTVVVRNPRPRPCRAVGQPN
jgi:hypothetical protein